MRKNQNLHTDSSSSSFSSSQMMDIILTFVMAGYENCSPTSLALQDMEVVDSTEKNLHIDAAEMRLVKQSLNRTLRRWTPR